MMVHHIYALLVEGNDRMTVKELRIMELICAYNIAVDDGKILL